MARVSAWAYAKVWVFSRRAEAAVGWRVRGTVGPVIEQPGPGFAGLLRQLRQEELAEAAGLSPRTVSDLERGVNRTAHKDTAGLLAGALGLEGPARGVFIAAARGRASAAEVLVARADALAGLAAVALESLPGPAAPQFSSS